MKSNERNHIHYSFVSFDPLKNQLGPVEVAHGIVHDFWIETVLELRTYLA